MAPVKGQMLKEKALSLGFGNTRMSQTTLKTHCTEIAKEESPLPAAE